MPSPEQLLSRFIRRINGNQDTPDLVMIIAADADHLRACRSIVDPADRSLSIPAATLERICHHHGWHPEDLKLKLTPAATVLGILPSTTAAVDHYQVLGVQKKATAQEIKHAFRSQAFHIHPDTAPLASENPALFLDVMNAYRTLRDPVRRQSYDADQYLRNQWREYPHPMPPTDAAVSVYRWYLMALIIIFIILLFITTAINKS